MLKKIVLVLTGFALAVVVFAVAGFAYAQTQPPPDVDFPCPFCGTGAGDGQGMHGGGFGSGMMSYDGEYGPRHETMMATFAEALGLSVEELETRHASGETMFEIVEAQGLSLEEFSFLMLEARQLALDQALTEGWITPEQAEWMQIHWEEMQASGYGPGVGPCQGGTPQGGRGGHGGGRWSGNQ